MIFIVLLTLIRNTQFIFSNYWIQFIFDNLLWKCLKKKSKVEHNTKTDSGVLGRNPVK